MPAIVRNRRAVTQFESWYSLPQDQIAKLSHWHNCKNDYVLKRLHLSDAFKGQSLIFFPQGPYNLVFTKLYNISWSEGKMKSQLVTIDLSNF